MAPVAAALIVVLFITGFYYSLLYSAVALVLAGALWLSETARQRYAVLGATILFLASPLIARFASLHLDLPFHFLAGLLVALYFSERFSKGRLLLLVFGVGVAWELAEYAAASLVGLPGYTAALDDLLLDLVMDVLGALVVTEQYIFKARVRR